MTTTDFTMANLARFAGREMGTSDWIEVGQARIDGFAACTGDDQWIHVDVERARRESPFGETIAHGYLTLSLLAPIVTQIGLVPGDAKGRRSQARARGGNAVPGGEMIMAATVEHPTLASYYSAPELAELIRAANAVLKAQESTLLRVVTKQDQVVYREKSRKSRAHGHQRKNGSGAVAPNPLNEPRVRSDR